ncbi:MAG: MoaD/ThiS family protein [Bacteroidetes bacterium]|nr:MoaD/ThiS family protein [Bacteroidota bacterium]
MSIQIKLFGQLVEIVGSNELELQGVSDTDLVRQRLIADFPKLRNYPFVIAVNKKIANQNQKINTDDVVALLPPFAGG